MARTRLVSFDEEYLQVGLDRAPVSTEEMDGKLASSYPGACAPPRHRPVPPRAPLRKPAYSDLNDVPPLALPTGPARKRSLSGSLASSATTRVDELCMLSGRGSSEDNMEAVAEEDDTFDAFEGGAFDALPDAEEDDEGGVFGFADEPDLDDFAELRLIGFDEEDSNDDAGAAARKILGGGGFSGGYGGVGLEEREAGLNGLITGSLPNTRTRTFSALSPKLSPQAPLGASPLLLSALEGVALEAGSFQLPEPAGRFRAASAVM